MHQKKLSRAILKTLIYSNIFDYPLTLKELRFYLLGNFVFSLEDVKKIKEISIKKEYFFLKNKNNIVEKRIERERISKNKLDIAKKIVKILSVTPTIYFIGLSGSLAMNNADVSDDIDLFIICSPHSIWITRLLVLLILQILGKRRKRNKMHSKNAICTNMFITKNALMLPKNKQNLFTAHEIVQVKSLFDRDNTYQTFLLENKWVQSYLPHAVIYPVVSQKSSIIQKAFEKILVILDFPARLIQDWYMHLHRTNETITNTMFAFHPQDVTSFVLSEYAKKLKKYGISI